ncbi:response regulator transcription factor [Cryobacterium sp. TMT1-21]|uniref:Response regulator transcription factor n=1 Tax=Cryobacterium shii TaxID=1259235 RepID=A0AAQ2C442_9MICO|nr:MULTISPECIES: response regulator transcription factor [Cryobacterium]TFC42555.1 response regulator transcription factor [Cryobacterium shii]TFC80887.1 response regulator transcription factor [Cryobacterium sp. TmT2-59]TFD13186.1 response regulator transcription factor [Cryobacterium sp. TMT1-21]TFD18607.1 response regulator transcription factor [Cryobacterium sp. TMT4-10]TFD28408.1 response regulator transcription factor [Cryobacterium sp. TMT2-23]
MRSILIVEDDAQMGLALERGIQAEGYETVLVDNGVDALINLANRKFAAAVVDVMLPRMSGFEICRHVRETGNAMPLLLLTARDAVDDRVTGLDAGADDYLTKPFSFAELAARIRALIRRDPAEQWIKVTAGDVTLDSQSRKGQAGGHPLSLSPNEFMLLRGLITQLEVPFTRQEILESVWGTATHIDANIVEQYVSTLRKKLSARGSNVSIVTVRGVGYLAKVDE